MFKKINYILFIMFVMFVFSSPAFADGGGSGQHGSGHIHIQANGSGDDVNVGNVNNPEFNAVTGELESNAKVEQNFEASDRAFPNQGGVALPGLPGYFGDNNKPGHQFIPLAKLTMYSTKWEVKSLKPYTTGSKFNFTPFVEKVAEADYSKFVVLTKDKFDLAKFDIKQCGFGTVNSTNKNTISSDLLVNTIVEASHFGATHIQFLSEGTNTRLEATGWGIGLTHTKAGESSISTGGTGISGGQSGYQNLPWQQFLILKVTPKKAAAKVETGAVELKTTDEAVKTDLDPAVEKSIQDKTSEADVEKSDELVQMLEKIINAGS